MRILIVEDDKEIAELLIRLLEKHNYIVDWQSCIELSYEAIRNASFDLVVLDRNLPDGDGLSLIKLLKEKMAEADIPHFLVLSALGDLSDRIFGLDSGAVDYIVKPYEPEELLARIRVRLRNEKPSLRSIIQVGNGEYDRVSHTYTVEGKVVTMRRRELIVFDLLVKNMGQVVSHRRIDHAVYSYDDDITSNTLSSQISRLRRALREARSGVHIIAMRHVGYILKEEI